MANVQLPSINVTPGDIDKASLPELQKIVKVLINTIAILTEELSYLLNNLDTRNVNEIDGDILVTGTITGDKVQANTITADKISVNELSAISANIGHILAGILEAVEIFGSVITGSTLQTATTGNRVVIDTQGFRTYDASNQKRVALGVNEQEGMAGHAYYGPNGNYEGQVYSVLGALHIIAANELFLRGLGNVLVQGDTTFDHNVTFEGNVTFNGVVDFTNATVIGL